MRVLKSTPAKPLILSASVDVNWFATVYSVVSSVVVHSIVTGPFWVQLYPFNNHSPSWVVLSRLYWKLKISL